MTRKLIHSRSWVQETSRMSFTFSDRKGAKGAADSTSRKAGGMRGEPSSGGVANEINI